MILCVRVFGLHVCPCTTCKPGARRSLMRVLDLLALEAQPALGVGK